MPCCHCQATDAHFDRDIARGDLERYRRKGPIPTTRAIVDALRKRAPAGATLLDVGAGIGAIHHRLLAERFASATHVEASAAYLAEAEAESARLGHEDRVAFVHGDVTELDEALGPAEVVTLDRVICCYPDPARLIAVSTGKCRRLYAVSYPRDRALVRLAFALENGWRRLRRNPFRAFVHPVATVQRLIEKAGLRRESERTTFMWRIELYARADKEEEWQQ